MSLGCLLIIYIGVAPALLGGVFIYILCNRFHKTFSKKDVKYLHFFFDSYHLLLYFMFYIKPGRYR